MGTVRLSSRTPAGATGKKEHEVANPPLFQLLRPLIGPDFYLVVLFKSTSPVSIQETKSPNGNRHLMGQAAQPEVTLTSTSDAQVLLDLSDSSMEETVNEEAAQTIRNEPSLFNDPVPNNEIPDCRTASCAAEWIKVDKRGTANLTGPVYPHPPIAPNLNLVSDHLNKGFRLIFTKLFVLYGPESVFDKCLMGFKINFRPLVGRRIVHCQSSIRFYVNAVGEYTKDIQIRALDPEIFIDEEAATEVEKNSSSLASLNVGYEPWVSGQLQKSAQTTIRYSTSARMMLSGTYTDTLWMTVEEDPSSNRGLPPSCQFSTLIDLPDSQVPFAAELTMKVKTVSSRFEPFSGKEHTLARTLLCASTSPPFSVDSADTNGTSFDRGQNLPQEQRGLWSSMQVQKQIVEPEL